MAKINELFPGKYFGAGDLQNKDVVVTIDRVELAEFEDAGRKVMKPVAYVVGSERGLVLNKTNATTIAEITGKSDTDDWGGARICLYPTMVQFGAKMTEAIRVKRVPEASAPTANSQTDPELNDELPFS